MTKQIRLNVLMKVLGLLISAALIGAAAVVTTAKTSTAQAQEDTDALVRLDDYGYEQVAVADFDGDIVIQSMPTVDSLSQLSGFWWVAEERTETLKKEDAVLPAYVTFREGLSLEHVESILKKVSIRTMRFDYGSEFAGQMPYPINQEYLAAMLAEARQVDPSLAADTPVLLVAARVQGDAKAIEALADLEEVFVVDVGPITYRTEFPGAEIFAITDVSFEYETYVAPYCSIDGLVGLLQSKKNAGLITDPAVAKSLVAELDGVKARINKGQVGVARNMLSAFVSHVDAQADKHIEKIAAGELIIVAECVRYSLLP